MITDIPVDLTFLNIEDEDYEVRPLKKAVGQSMEKLPLTLSFLRTKKENFQNMLESETMRESHCEAEVQTLRKSITYEYEKMNQFLLEEKQSYFQRLEKEATDELADESNDISSLDINSLSMMLKSMVQTRKELVTIDFRKKHQFLLKEEKLHMQRLDQEVRENLEKYKESKVKLCQQISFLNTVISEAEKNFEKYQVDLLEDISEKNQELLRQDPVAALPRRTKCFIPGMTEMLMTFHRDITMDPNTANPHLIVSDDLKSVRYDCIPQDVPDNPERFDFALTVLATQSFTSGKHYWEVEMGDITAWEVGICKESVIRKGNVLKLPEGAYTLLSFKAGNDYYLCNSYVSIQIRQPLHKVGIFLDYEKGHLAFYNATDRTLIHSYQNVAFQGLLHPCFNLCYPNAESNPGSLKICPKKNQ